MPKNHFDKRLFRQIFNREIAVMRNDNDDRFFIAVLRQAESDRIRRRDYVSLPPRSFPRPRHAVTCQSGSCVAGVDKSSTCSMGRNRLPEAFGACLTALDLLARSEIRAMG